MPRLRSTSHWSDPREKPLYGAAEIHHGHQLAPKFLFLLNEAAGTPYELKTGINGSVATIFAGDSGARWVTAANGQAFFFNHTIGSQYHSIDLSAFASRLTIAAPFSVEAWWDWQGSGTKGDFSGPVNCRTSSYPGFQMVDVQGSTDRYRPALEIWNGTTDTNAASGATTYLRPFNKRFLWTWDGSTAVLYTNGVPDGATSMGAGGYASPIATTNLGGGYKQIAGNLVRVVIWSRVLSASEALGVYHLPYIFLRPIIRRRYFAPPAAPAAPSAGVFIQERIGQGIGRGVLAGR